MSPCLSREREVVGAYTCMIHERMQQCISCVPVYLLFSKRGVLGSGHAAQAQTIAGRYACHCSSEVYRQIDAYALVDVCTVPFVSAITATLKYYFFYAKH